MEFSDIDADVSKLFESNVSIYGSCLPMLTKLFAYGLEKIHQYIDSSSPYMRYDVNI